MTRNLSNNGLAEKDQRRSRFTRRALSKLIDHKRSGRLHTGTFTASNPPKYGETLRDKATGHGVPRTRLADKRALRRIMADAA